MKKRFATAQITENEPMWQKDDHCVARLEKVAPHQVRTYLCDERESEHWSNWIDGLIYLG